MKHLVRLTALCAILLFAAACNDMSDPSAPSLDESASANGSEDEQLSAQLEDEGISDHRGYARKARYELVLENLTPDTGDGGSQVFSPVVYATHNPSLRMWRAGALASDALAAIAEDAVNQPMLDVLAASRKVHDYGQGEGVVFPGQSTTWEIEAGPGKKRLSMAFMLVNTNDGFAGTDALRLPRRGTKTVYLRAYDAGSEANTEAATDIPGPCCGSPGMGTPTSERIHRHPGIQGTGDLSVEKYGWSEPVAKLTIRRIR